MIQITASQEFEIEQRVCDLCRVQLNLLKQYLLIKGDNECQFHVPDVPIGSQPLQNLIALGNQVFVGHAFLGENVTDIYEAIGDALKGAQHCVLLSMHDLGADGY